MNASRPSALSRTAMLHLQHVLFPTDRTAWSEVAFAHAARAARRHGATLHVLTVTVGMGHAESTLVTAPPGELDAFEARLHEAAAEGVGCEVVHADIAARSVTHGILDYAARVDADLVVMATHGWRGLDHAYIGSVAEAVVRRSSCPVLTVRPTAERAPTAPASILIPLDLSAHARTALAHARELRDETGAQLHLLHVVEMLPRYGFVDLPPEPAQLSDAEREAAEGRLREIAAEVLGPDAPPTMHVVPGMGNPALGVLEVAERLRADLIVLASHGRTGVRRFLMGSVAEKVVQLAPCPVFTVKAFGKSVLPGVAVRAAGEEV